MTVFEDEDAFEAAESTESSTKHAPPVALEINPKDERSASGPIDYNLYRTFWDLQRFFREHTLATSSATQWEQFVRTVYRSILALAWEFKYSCAS